MSCLDSWSMDVQGPEQTALSPYKGYVHLPRFIDFPRVSWYARGASEDLHGTSEHFSLCAPSLLSYIRYPLFDARNLSRRKMHRETIFRYNRLISYDRSRVTVSSRHGFLVSFSSWIPRKSRHCSAFSQRRRIFLLERITRVKRTERVSLYGGLSSKRFQRNAR